MYVPEDVQFWLDNFCDNVKEIFTAYEEKYECNSSRSDYGDGEFGRCGKKFLSESLLFPPSHVFSH